MRWQKLPSGLNALFELILPRPYPRRVVFFGDADAGMAEEDRYLIDGNASQKHLDGEGIAEHMAVATFWRAVRLAEIGDFEKPAICTLPVGDKRLRQTVA